MAKPNRTNLKTRPSVNGLIARGFQDLKRYLSEAERKRLEFLIESKTPEDELTLEIEKMTSAAETQAVSYLNLAALRQLSALFQKNKDRAGTDANSRKKAAILKFYASERKCRRTNKRLAYYSTHMGRMPDGVQSVVHSARKIIYEILGELSHINLVKVIDGSGFGPGATFSSTTSEHSNLYYKIGGPHAVTADALPYLKVWLHYWDAWKGTLISENSTYEVVEGNRITTVPKTAVIDRTIAIEPSLNVFMQKGVDTYLKKRLRRFGVTLDNQERNHTPARDGSQRPNYSATVDLSSASDCVSIGVMRLLFPTDWLELLNSLRSPAYLIPSEGNTFAQYEKFSSMGNAFTFPIETIIFYAVSKACTIYAGGNLEPLRVYGDDIIIDPRAYCMLTECLEFLGFSVNLDKSFVFGNFRETCGADFYSGVDLRPVYVRNIPINDQEVYNLFNRLIWNRVGFRFHNLCEYLWSCVDKPLYGPPSLPPGKEYWRWKAGKSVHYDHYFHAPSDALKRFKRYDPDLQCEVWRIEVLRYVPKKLDISNFNLQVLYMTFLLMGRSNGVINSNRHFRRTTRYETISYWPPPPWCPYLYDSVESAWT
jgi:hypothetical protein